MITMLMASLGLLPAAIPRRAIGGSDSQQAFAIMIVGGPIVDLVMSVLILPTFYVWLAREGDKLPEQEASFEG